MPIFRARDVKAQRHLVLFLWGLPWSGKTFTALQIGTRLAAALKKGNGKPGDGRFCLIDTENKSSLDYKEDFDFDFFPLEPPFAPEVFIKALLEVSKAGYSAVCIDSLSSEWGEDGGVLRLIDKLKETEKNKLAPWAVMTPRHEFLIQALNRCPMPVIVTAKSTIKTVLDETVDDRGGKKTNAVKLAEKAVFRDQDEYHFKVIAQVYQPSPMSKDRILAFNGKCRVRALDGLSFTNPGQEVVDPIVAWIKGDGADNSSKEDAAADTAEGPDLETLLEKASDPVGGGPITGQPVVQSRFKSNAHPASEAASEKGATEAPPAQEAVTPTTEPAAAETTAPPETAPPAATQQPAAASARPASRLGGLRTRAAGPVQP